MPITSPPSSILALAASIAIGLGAMQEPCGELTGMPGLVVVRNAGWEQGARNRRGEPVEDWQASQPSKLVVADPELRPLGIPESLVQKASLHLDWHPRSCLRVWLYSRQDDDWKPLSPGSPFSPPCPSEVPVGMAPLYLEGLNPGPAGRQRLSLSLGEVGNTEARDVTWQATLLGLETSESESTKAGLRQLSLAWPGPDLPEELEVRYLQTDSEPAESPALGLRFWLETGEDSGCCLAPGAYTREKLQALGLKKGTRKLRFRIETTSPPPGTLPMDEQALEIVLRPHRGMPTLRLLRDFSNRE